MENKNLSDITYNSRRGFLQSPMLFVCEVELWVLVLSPPPSLATFTVTTPPHVVMVLTTPPPRVHLTQFAVFAKLATFAIPWTPRRPTSIASPPFLIALA